MGFWDWLMGTPPEQKTAPARRVSSTTPSMRRATVFGLQVGDVVSYDDIDYLVKNKITYEEEGFYWYDFLLVDEASDSEIWLSAEDDDGITIGIYREIDLDGIPPVPKSLTWEGKTYRQEEHSFVNVSLEREDADRDTASQVEYWDFEGPNGMYLGVLKWGGNYEASVGSEIREYDLKIFPAS